MNALKNTKHGLMSRKKNVFQTNLLLQKLRDRSSFFKLNLTIYYFKKCVAHDHVSTVHLAVAASQPLFEKRPLPMKMVIMRRRLWTRIKFGHAKFHGGRRVFPSFLPQGCDDAPSLLPKKLSYCPCEFSRA